MSMRRSSRAAVTAAVHMICGYRGAGKTTFARRLEQELPAVRFTHDEWIFRKFGPCPPGVFAEHFERAAADINLAWPECLRRGMDVIVDHGFWHRHQRDELRRMATALDASHRLYYLRCAPDVGWARVAHRNADGSPNMFISRDLFESLRDRFEPPGADECAVVIET